MRGDSGGHIVQLYHKAIASSITARIRYERCWVTLSVFQIVFPRI
jgi:hypothetical protein